MLLPKFGVRKPVTNIMIFSCVAVLAVYALMRLPIDIMPEIEPPAISVITIYEGASPEDVETRVTEVLEDTLATTPNLDKLTSKSMEGISLITCHFDWGTNLDEAGSDIRDRIEMAKRMLPDIPDEIDNPRLFKFNTATFPILFMGITAEESYNKLDDIVDKKIADEMERIPGVGSTMRIGGLTRQINIFLDRARFEAYDLSLQEVVGRLAAENITMPVGTIKMGLKEYTLRVPSEFKDPGELEEVIVGQKGEALIYLKDIARIEDSFKEQIVAGRMNQRRSIILFVQKQWGANTVEVSKKVRSQLEKIKQGLPPDVSIHIITDNSEFIVDAVRNLSTTLYYGIILVIIITVLLLRQVRPSIIIALTIPFSLLIAFVFFHLFGYTLNMVTLASLVIAVGMVVDSAIVVVDNTYRHLEGGEGPVDAAINGASEMGMAVTASVLTTVVVFAPLIFTKGLVSIIFGELALTVTVTLLASLFTSLTLSPMLCSKFLKSHQTTLRNTYLQKVFSASEKYFTEFEQLYLKTLTWALAHRRRVIIASIAIFFVSILVVPFVGTEFFPEEDSGDIRVTAEMPIGTRLEETYKMSQRFEEILKREVPEARIIFARSGTPPGGFGAAFGQKVGSNIIFCGAKLVKKNQRKRTNREIAQILRGEFAKIPGLVKLSVSTADPMAGMLFGGMGKKISLEITGHSMEETTALAERIKNIMRGVPGTADVSISRDIGLPEVVIEIDREKESALGLNTRHIIDTIRTAFQGDVATRYREGGEQYDVLVRLREEDRRSFEDIKNFTITSPFTRGKIRLDNIARLVEKRGPVEIERQNRERIIKVESDVYKRPMGDVINDIEAKIDKLAIPAGISLNFGGEAEEQRKAFRDLVLLVILSILLVYMVMASQFESLLDPFIIMFSVPFSFVGVIWGFLFTGTTLSMITFLGLVMLIGIVVNNAIVFVSYIIILRSKGAGVYDAILKAGAHRLRPIMMTTLTTIFGMVPLILIRGEGSETWNPLGITMIGGLTVSTLVTLILVPILYSVLEARIPARTD